MTLRDESGTGPPAGPPGSSAAGPSHPPRRRRTRAALLIGGLAAIALTRTAREPQMTLRDESGTGPPARPPGPSAAGPRHPPRRRRTRAALLIGGLAAVALIGLGSLAVVLLHGRAHATQAVLPSVFGLRAGQCVNFGPGGVSSPTVVPCVRAHDAEIYARFDLTGSRWPGAAGIGALARRGCTARLGGYLNPQLATAVLAESYVFPDRGAWNAGERTVICEIRGTAGKLTGSVRGLG